MISYISYLLQICLRRMTAITSSCNRPFTAETLGLFGIQSFTLESVLLFTPHSRLMGRQPVMLVNIVNRKSSKIALEDLKSVNTVTFSFICDNILGTTYSRKLPAGLR